MGMVKMKGQIFIIASVMILLALLLTRVSTKTVDIKQDENFYESFTNLKEQMVRTVDLGLVNQESVSSRLDDFIAFSKEVYARKGYNESVNYTVAGTVAYINVSLSSANSYLLEELIVNRTVHT
jgi:hypothetical protein